MNTESENQVIEKGGLYARKYRKKIDVIERNVKLSDEEKLEAFEKLLYKLQKTYDNTDIDAEPSKVAALVMFALGVSSASEIFQNFVGSEAFQSYGDVEQFFAGAGSLFGSAAVGVLTMLAASIAIVPVQFLKEKLAEKKCSSLFDVIEELKKITYEYRAKINEQAKQN